MTTQQSHSRLDGWRGPVFPAVTPRLIEVLRGLPEAERSGTALREKLVGIPGLESLVELTASDGYTWPTVALISVHGGVIAVALPGPSLDRSPAAYYKGQHINSETANAIMARVIRALRPNPGRRPVLTGP